eukprot:TRINITY_DN3280_c0_g1_i2.p1 TRINITY_DN3280_c0_g1~~TRINITY_DN3280_c0_g1_i2.p1  ORF type:complete len:1050 (+),score=225.30 TRINITY_DN3280_c0_g1_i2:207-3356(+)
MNTEESKIIQNFSVEHSKNICAAYFIYSGLFEVLSLIWIMYFSRNRWLYLVFLLPIFFTEFLIFINRNEGRNLTKYYFALMFFSYCYIMLSNESFDVLFLFLFIISSMITQIINCNVKKLLFGSIVVCSIAVSFSILLLPFNFFLGLKCSIFELFTLYFAIISSQTFFFAINKYRSRVIEYLFQMTDELKVVDSISHELRLKILPKFIFEVFHNDYFKFPDEYDKISSVVLGDVDFKENISTDFSSNVKIYKDVPVLCCYVPSNEVNLTIFDRTDFLMFYREYLVFVDKLVALYEMEKLRVMDNLIIITPKLKQLKEWDMSMANDCFSDTDTFESPNDKKKKNYPLTSTDDCINDCENHSIFGGNKNHYNKIFEKDTQKQINDLVKFAMILNDMSKLCGMILESNDYVSIGIAVGYLCVTIMGHSNHKVFSWGTGMNEAIRLAYVGKSAKLSFDRKIFIQPSLFYCLQPKFHCSMFNFDENIILNVHYIKKRSLKSGPDFENHISISKTFKAFPFNRSEFTISEAFDKVPFDSFESPLETLRAKSVSFLSICQQRDYKIVIILRLLLLSAMVKIIANYSHLSTVDQANLSISFFYNFIMSVKLGPYILGEIGKRSKQKLIKYMVFVPFSFLVFQNVLVSYSFSNEKALFFFGNNTIPNIFLLTYNHMILWIVCANAVTLVSFVINFGFKHSVTGILTGQLLMISIGFWKKNYFLVILIFTTFSQLLRYVIFCKIWLHLTCKTKNCYLNVYHRVKTIGQVIPQYALEALLRNDRNELIWDHKDGVVAVIKLKFILINNEFLISLRCAHKQFDKHCSLRREEERNKTQIDIDIAKNQLYSVILEKIEKVILAFSEITLIDWRDDQILLIGDVDPSEACERDERSEDFIEFNKCSQMLNCVSCIIEIINEFNEKNDLFVIKHTAAVNHGDFTTGIFAEDRINYFCYGLSIYRAKNIAVDENSGLILATKKFAAIYKKTYNFAIKKLDQLAQSNTEEFEKCVLILNTLNIPGSIFNLQNPKNIHSVHRNVFCFVPFEEDVFQVQHKKKRKGSF